MGLTKDIIDLRSSLVGLVGYYCVQSVKIIQTRAKQVAAVDRVFSIAFQIKKHDPGIVRFDEVRARICIGPVKARDDNISVKQVLVPFEDPLNVDQSSLAVGVAQTGQSICIEHVDGQLLSIFGCQIYFLDSASYHQDW